jgi:hypothetical protein
MRLMDRVAIERELLHWMRSEPDRHDPERFERLALALYAHQFEHCEPYGRFAAARGARPSQIETWREIPPVPTGAFKELPLRSFHALATKHVFRTSGTSAEKRGALYLDTLELYEASLLPSFETGVFPELLGTRGRMPILVLAPSPAEADDSSLSHMFGIVLRARGAAGSDYFVRRGRLELASLALALEAAIAAGTAIALCGTAFAFVHLLEAMQEAGRRIVLPAGTRIVETGGFKGRSRELSRDALYAELHERLGVPPERIVNQYGMTELGSQFYDSVLVQPHAPRHKLAPPWTRVRIVHPDTGWDMPAGEVGLIQILDLANTGSVLAVQTADLGRELPGGFEVVGRSAGAEARGCSIAADEMLGVGRS